MRLLLSFVVMLHAALVSAQTTLSIHAIQGAGVESSVRGATVRTGGIVTAVRSNGFYVQTPDAARDSDSETSEGIFVYTSSLPAVSVGDDVRVVGRVTEYRPSSDEWSLPLTELAGSIAVEVLARGVVLPAAIELTTAELRPGVTPDALERFEGMRVSIASLRVVGPTGGRIREETASAESDGAFFAVLDGTPLPLREPGVHQLVGLPASAPCCVPRFDGNIEVLRIESAGAGGAPIDVAAGSRVSGITGILDTWRRRYAVVVEANASPGVEPPSALPLQLQARGTGEIALASFNLRRFYDDRDGSGNDVVLTAAAFGRRLDKVAATIVDVLRIPEVVVVQEVEDIGTLRAIAAAVSAKAVAEGGAAGYEAVLFEGNDISMLDVGALVKSTVQIVSSEQRAAAATFVHPRNGTAATTFDRPPIVLRLRAGSSPLPLTIVGLHLRSLSGIDDSDGEFVRAKRKAQAEEVARIVEGLHGENVVVAGDFNAFEFSDGWVDVTGTIRGEPARKESVVEPTEDHVGSDLLNAALFFPPLAERYSYRQEGTAELIDQILVSRSLFRYVRRMEFGRVNAGQPQSALNFDGPLRASDHDIPLLVIGEEGKARVRATRR